MAARFETVEVPQEIREWLEAKNLDGKLNDFLYSMYAKMVRYGTLTPKMVAALERAKQQDTERKADKAAADAVADDFIEGRMDTEATIVSAKWRVGNFGENLKLLVTLPGGNKAYGNAPKSFVKLLEDADEGIEAAKDMKIILTATFKKSDRDEHFGFFSRAEVSIDEEGEV